MIRLSGLLLGILFVAGIVWAQVPPGEMGEPFGQGSPAAEITALVVLAAGLAVWINAVRLWLVRGWVLRQKPLNLIPWGLGVPALILVGFLVVKMGLQAVVVSTVGEDPGTWWFVGESWVSGLATLVLVVVVVKWHGVTLECVGLTPDNPGQALGLAAAGLAAVTPVLIGLGWLLKWRGDPVEQELVKDMLGMSGGELAVTGLTAVILAPVVEELVFRGVVQATLTRYLGAGWGILTTAALFASFHRPYGVAILIFPLGLMLGYLYHRRQSLISPILLHALKNAMTIGMMVLIRKG